jgi:hypothetical protein
VQIIAGSEVEIREIWLASECVISMAEYNRNNSARAAILKSQGHLLEKQILSPQSSAEVQARGVAVAHKILVSIYHMFSPRVYYNE